MAGSITGRSRDLERELVQELGDQLASAAHECIARSRTLLKKPFADPLGADRDDSPS